MSEVLAAERWRDEKLGPCTAVSVRKGTLQHSVKYKHPNGYKMVDTNWRMGIDKPTYTTTTRDASCVAWNANLTSLMPRIDKNASSDNILGGYAARGGKEHFATMSQVEHKSTVYDPAYKRSRPAPGFDRLTAGKTNYSLGSEKPVLEVTTSTSHLHYPPPGHAEQANIGGWHTKSGEYFNDVDVRESMKRGNQGSSGIFGYRFNIITGAPKERAGEGDGHVHAQHLKTREPRVSRNVTEKWIKQVDAWGDPGRMKPDLLSGKFRQTVDPPPVMHTVERRGDPVLCTRPW